MRFALRIEEYVAALEEAGYVNGRTDGTYGADDNITRAEVCVMLNRILGREIDKEKPIELTNKFTDLESYRWYYLDVLEAAVDHLIKLHE